jgi:hypothetical protein
MEIGGRKYYLQYKDTQDVEYEIDIFDKNFNGDSTLIGGYAVIEYGSVNTNLDTIRGKGMTLYLEASLDLTFEDLYSEVENTFKVFVYRNGVGVFSGFVKPDGLFQDFVNERWEISLDCVDNLGVLENLAFVDADGIPYAGKLSIMQIIANCLKRTENIFNINTSINISYEGFGANDIVDPLVNVFLSTSRFVKDDENTIMNCAEVLESVLSLFNAVISQNTSTLNNSEWFIYRPNEIYNNSLIKFRRYEFENNLTRLEGYNEVDLAFNLGSQINNKYPHHCNGNQRIGIKGSVSAYRINYKYGFELGLLNNPNFSHVGLAYDSYTVNNNTYIITDPNIDVGLKMQASNSKVLTLTSQAVPLLEGELINISGKISGNFNNLISFNIKLGIYSLNSSGQWVTGGITGLARSVSSFTFLADPLPVSGNLVIEIYSPTPRFGETQLGIMTLERLDVINLSNTNTNNLKGEFHTVQRLSKPSSIAKDTVEIYNGDNPSIIYDGAIFKNDKITTTSKWFRRDFTESLTILQIAAEDALRASQLPSKIFSGNVFGYLPYMSLINIDGVTGKFMPIEYSFDTKNNITSLKSLELFGDELTDIDYKFAYDYGTTVKPTIK